MSNSLDSKRIVYEEEASKILNVKLPVLRKYAKRATGTEIVLPFHTEAAQPKKRSKIYYIEGDLLAFNKTGVKLPVFEDSKPSSLIKTTDADKYAIKKDKEEVKRNTTGSSGEVSPLF